jgi:hypothetical protein
MAITSTTTDVGNWTDLKISFVFGLFRQIRK